MLIFCVLGDKNYDFKVIEFQCIAISKFRDNGVL